VLRAGLNWRQVEVLRTCCKYLLQIGIPFSQAYMEQTLVQNAGLAGRLAALFEARFDPALKGDRGALLARLEAEFRAGLDTVANLDKDRILRRFMRLILGRSKWRQCCGPCSRAAISATVTTIAKRCRTPTASAASRR
jgi:glutamate dehydrogenase